MTVENEESEINFFSFKVTLGPNGFLRAAKCGNVKACNMAWSGSRRENTIKRQTPVHL